MSPANQSIAAALIYIALGGPALAHTNPLVRWQIRTAPDPVSLLVALGPSNGRCLKGRPHRADAHRSELADLRPAVTGWTQPFGLRAALRW